MPENQNQETTQNKLDKLDEDIKALKESPEDLPKENKKEFKSVIRKMDKALEQLDQRRESAISHNYAIGFDNNKSNTLANDEKYLEAKEKIVNQAQKSISDPVPQRDDRPTAEKLEELNEEINKVKDVGLGGLDPNSKARFEAMLDKMNENLEKLDKSKNGSLAAIRSGHDENVQGKLRHTNDELFLEDKKQIFSESVNKMLAAAEKLEKQADKGTAGQVVDVLKSAANYVSTAFKSKEASKDAKQELKSSAKLATGKLSKEEVSAAKKIAAEMRDIRDKKEQQPRQAQTRQPTRRSDRGSRLG